MGRSLADVRSVVLTHGHSDHVGFAERIRRERGVPIRVHELDAALARSEVPNPSKGVRPDPAPTAARVPLFSLDHGLLRIPRIQEVAVYGDGATLDVPGAPKVILLPGHTPGSAALHFEGHDALCIGDALATYAVTTGAEGPRSRRSPPMPARQSNRCAGSTGSRSPTCCRATASRGSSASGPRSPRFALRRH